MVLPLSKALLPHGHEGGGQGCWRRADGSRGSSMLAPALPFLQPEEIGQICGQALRHHAQPGMPRGMSEATWLSPRTGHNRVPCWAEKG